MKNEPLCKPLAHNRCGVSMSQCELGIEPVFWGDSKPERAPDIVPLVRPG
jgi:hypothetical protein